MTHSILSSKNRSLILAGALALIYAVLVVAAAMAAFRAEFMSARVLAFVALGFSAASCAVSRASMRAHKQ